MKNKIKAFIISSIFFTNISDQIFPQCSDAGVCQLIPVVINNDKVFDFSLSYKFGLSGEEENVKYHSILFNSTYYLFKASSINLRIPYNIQFGSAGRVNGIGDLILSWDQNLFSTSTSLLSASVGIKLATGNENKGRDLPMAYQPGLGSNDFILVVNYSYYYLNFSAGYQFAGGRNNNSLTRLKRGDDLLLRGSYNLNFEKLQIQPQLLFIKRLSKSSILDLNSPEEKFIEVENSDQLQLNFLTTFEYKISTDYLLIAELAVPFLKREVNIDGLKRSFSTSIGFNYYL